MRGLVALLNGFQVVRMVELLGLLGSLDYIRGKEGIGGLSKLQNIKQQVIPETIPSPSFNALKCSCQWCRVDSISL